MRVVRAWETGNKRKSTGRLIQKAHPNIYTLIVRGEQGISPPCRRGQEENLLGIERTAGKKQSNKNVYTENLKYKPSLM